MRTWDQLSKLERSMSLGRAKVLLINLVIDGVVEIDMPNVETRKVFNRIIKDMRQVNNKDKRIALLYSDKSVSMELEKLVTAAAHGARYDDKGLTIMEQQ